MAERTREPNSMRVISFERLVSLSSNSDSDYQFLKQSGYCLSSQRKPLATLKFILTSWYSPETSLAISGLFFCYIYVGLIFNELFYKYF